MCLCACTLFVRATLVNKTLLAEQLLAQIWRQIQTLLVVPKAFSKPNRVGPHRTEPKYKPNHCQVDCGHKCVANRIRAQLFGGQCSEQSHDNNHNSAQPTEPICKHSFEFPLASTATTTTTTTTTQVRANLSTSFATSGAKAKSDAEIEI